MKRYRPVKYQETPSFPELDQVKAYTEDYRTNRMDRENPDYGYWLYEHTLEIEVKVIGGINNYFLVYAYPPAGYEYVYVQEALDLEAWRGWILELLTQEPTYRLDCASHREGVEVFRLRKAELGY